MQSQRVQQLIDRFENDPDHELTIEEWTAILWRISEEHISRPASGPRRFRDHLHRLLTYRLRAALGQDLFHADDVSPPEQELKNVLADTHAFNAIHEEGGSKNARDAASPVDP